MTVQVKKLKKHVFIMEVYSDPGVTFKRVGDAIRKNIPKTGVRFSQDGKRLYFKTLTLKRRRSPNKKKASVHVLRSVA